MDLYSNASCNFVRDLIFQGVSEKLEALNYLSLLAGRPIHRRLLVAFFFSLPPRYPLERSIYRRMERRSINYVANLSISV